MSEMGLESSGNENNNKVSNTFRLVLFDQETNLGHANFTNMSTPITRGDMLAEQSHITRRRREANPHSISDYDKVEY